MSHAQAAIDLAALLVGTHDKSVTGSITVVPVVVDDLMAVMPVVRAISELTGALLLDTNEMANVVPKTEDILRSAAWRAGLDLDPPGLRRRVVLEDAGPGLCEARFEPPSGVVPSPGDNTILKVVLAAVHGHLDSHEIGIVLYREAPLDFVTRRAAWKAVVERFVDVPHQRLRTLIVVVEGAIDVKLHCRTRIGFRYALDGERLLQRRGEDDLLVQSRQIAAQKEPIVFFLGAGFSQSSNLQLGNQFRDSAIKRLLGFGETDTFSSLDLAKRFHGWISGRQDWMTQSERGMGQHQYALTLTLEQVVRAEVQLKGSSATLQEFKDHHDMIVDRPGPAVRDLLAILEDGANRVVLTGVNFDRLVEHNAEVPIKVFATDEDFQGAPAYVESYLSGEETAIPYLKLHGSIDQPDSCIVSAEQTERGIGEAKLAALRSLRNDPARLWVYVGASMRDRDLLPVLNNEEFGRGLDERWVAPYLAETVEAFGVLRIPYWKRSWYKTIQDRIITETADVFFAALREAWEPS